MLKAFNDKIKQKDLVLIFFCLKNILYFCNFVSDRLLYNLNFYKIIFLLKFNKKKSKVL